jgi:hypothetical protein
LFSPCKTLLSDSESTSSKISLFFPFGTLSDLIGRFAAGFRKEEGDGSEDECLFGVVFLFFYWKKQEKYQYFLHRIE